MISKFRIDLDGVSYEIEQKGNCLTINGREWPFSVEGTSVHVSGTHHTVTLSGKTAVVDGISYAYATAGLEEKRQMNKRKAASKSAAEEAGAITAIMPGLIMKIMKKEGDVVERDEVVMILEAMKMQNELGAPKAGTIRKILVKAGDSVEIRQVLAVIE
ncbi:hypothetical protein JW823_06225 [bacterium]|nr:hypothetical protein [candidate division CSSED10-310 bacterium]